MGFKLMVFRLQLNCSYLHHNVKGVLVEQEHKSKQKLFPVSQRRRKMELLVGLRGGLLFPLQLQSRAAAVSEHSKSVWRYRSTWMWMRVRVRRRLLHEQKEQMIERTGPRNQQRTRMLGKEDKLTPAGVVHEVRRRQKFPKTTLFS